MRCDAVCRLDPLEEARLMVLRLPPPRVPKPAPQYAMLPVVGWHEAPAHDFVELQAWSAGHLFLAVPQLQVRVARVGRVRAADGPGT